MDPARVEVSGRFQGLMFNVVARMVMGRGRYGCVLSVAVADGKPKIHFGHRQHHVKPLRVVEAGQASPLSKESDCGDRDRARGGWRLRKVPVRSGIRPAFPAAPDNSQQLRPNPLHATSSLLPSPDGSPRLPCFRSFPTTLLPTMAASGAPALLRAWQRAGLFPSDDLFPSASALSLFPSALALGLFPLATRSPQHRARSRNRARRLWLSWASVPARLRLPTPTSASPRLLSSGGRLPSASALGLPTRPRTAPLGLGFISYGLGTRTSHSALDGSPRPRLHLVRPRHSDFPLGLGPVPLGLNSH